MKRQLIGWFSLLCATISGFSASHPDLESSGGLHGISYTNDIIASVPWSIHIVRISRSSPEYELRSMHAEGQAVGLSTLSDQVRLSKHHGTPVAAVNGDFYEREGAFAGDPRGLQIVDGEVLSDPAARPAFWIDTNSQPHLDTVTSKFFLVLPNAPPTRFSVNARLAQDRAGVYTPSFNEALPNSGAHAVIVHDKSSSFQPLHMGDQRAVTVDEIVNAREVPAQNSRFIIAMGPDLADQFSALRAGSEITISARSTPDLSSARTAISGGPILLAGGAVVRTPGASSGSFEFRSMVERHPRTAIGWNDEEYFMIEVDGRQHGSVGMTLDELRAYMQKLGCRNAMNLDGGGSATLWFDGKVRNNPCEGHERQIANSLVVVRKSVNGPAAHNP